MKYWGYFLAKLAAAVCIVHWLIGVEIHGRSTYDPIFRLWYMIVVLLAIGLLSLIVWDQRYRCRTCLRRLRMPITAGSWPNMFLIGQPRVEYICLYGHGTLKMPEVDLTGPKLPAWEPHSDMWRELEELQSGKR